MGRSGAARPSSAFATVDLGRDGRQLGFLMIPHSPNDDAWGVTRVPLAVLANGSGPTLVLAAGNHGDEYEGQIAICDLIRELDPGSIQGRLVLMPALNVHAVLAGQRVSPIDGLNFNRTFPGNPSGTITEQISAFVADHVFPLADAFVDLHSGGSSMTLLPSANIQPVPDPSLHARNVAAARAFAAPYTIVNANLGESRTATAAACQAGLVTFSTEMGGGGATSVEGLRLCRRGVRRILAQFGLLPPEEADAPSLAGPVLEMAGAGAFVFADTDGVFEPMHELGAQVRDGQPAGRIHCPWDPGRAPSELRYRADGILYGCRQPGRVKPGNCCLVVASPYGGPLD